MNRFTDGSFSCSCLSIRWFFPFGSAGRCTQSLSSLLGVVLGFCSVWERLSRFSKKNIYCSLKHNFVVTRSLFDLHTRQFVASLCVTKGEKQPTQAGWSRCLGSTPWANLGSIDEVAEVKLNLIKVACIPPTRKGRQIRDSPEKKFFAHAPIYCSSVCH